MNADIYSRFNAYRLKQMRGLVAATLLVAGMCPSFVHAADANGRFNIDCISNEMSCGAFVSAREETRRGNHIRENKYTSWLYGFLTAYNLLQSDTYDIDGTTDVSSQMLWLENYCKAHPLDSFGEAAVSLTTVL